MENPAAKRILIVDDEAPVRAICTRVLEPLGFQIETAENADAAFARFDKEPFDLVITDYRMPGELNGLTLCQAVKRRSPNTSVIVMTAFPAVDTAVETLRAGGLDYLIKPFDQAELVHRVQVCFRGCSES